MTIKDLLIQCSDPMLKYEFSDLAEKITATVIDELNALPPSEGAKLVEQADPFAEAITQRFANGPIMTPRLIGLIYMSGMLHGEQLSVGVLELEKLYDEQPTVSAIPVKEVEYNEENKMILLLKLYSFLEHLKLAKDFDGAVCFKQLYAILKASAK